MGGWSKVERFRALTAAPLLWLAACGSKPLSSAETDEDGGLGGTLLSVPVPSSGEALVALATPAVLPVVGEERPAFGWDLGFRGLEVFTNGGVSSSGAGAGSRSIRPGLLWPWRAADSWAQNIRITSSKTRPT